jgi:hypothetical protein
MQKRIAAVLALAGMLAAGACGDREDGANTSTSDTTTVPGTDVVEQPVTVPTTDTLVTTTTTETDTIHGEADDDSVHADTTHR